jgi:heme/copper-type cytochrome/quinol oxidase subunit 2
MHLTRHASFRAVNDLLHDLAAGVGPGAVLALWLARGGALKVLDPAAVLDMTRSWTWVLLILFVALVVLVVTGAVRLSYHNVTTRPEKEAERGRAALIKHVVFAAIFVGSAIVAFGLLQG